jgi:diguanylate cyclase (GGDEF)-like protein
MKFSGRSIVYIAVILSLTIKIYGILYYNYPIFNIPFIGIIIVFLSWLLGKQYDKVKFLSEKDVLTKLYNRRFMILNFPNLIAAVDRNQKKLILYFIDVDDFKIINDSMGHELGDQVLQRIANVLMLHSRKGDMVIRWAGDEFLILSPFSDDRNKVMMIRSIKNELKLSSQDFNIAISVSIGTAEYPNEAQTLDDLIHAADQNMYTLKSRKKG